MPSTKRIVLEVLASLPDDCSLQDVADRLRSRQGVEAFARDAEERRLDHLDEVMRQARMYLEG